MLLLFVFLCKKTKRGGGKINDLYEQVKERLSLIEDMYDIIGIVDPINKNLTIIKDDEIGKFKWTCYDFWKRGVSCNNCISMRAYTEKDTFLKIEYADNKVILVIATPVVIDERIYVIEMLKDISKSGSIFDINTNSEINICTMINEVNNKIIRDDLTGVYNRRYIAERLTIDINNSIIHESPLSVILTDIDNFKDVNDKYGHIIGDKTIQYFANLISSLNLKNSDWIGRYGGDEFLIVLNNTNKENAFKVSAKIRKLLKETPFQYNDTKIQLTSSSGIYCTKGEKIDIESILIAVDKKLYEVKRKSKNRTINAAYLITKDNKLLILNGKILKLRNILNEMCISSDEIDEDKIKLNISQYLDELIVEYMKIIYRK